MSVTGALPEISELSSTADPKIRTLLSELKAEVNTLGERQQAIKWYEPKVIAAEQTRESTTAGVMATPDEITGVVVPANGLVLVYYDAQAKASTANGVAEVFINGSGMGNLGLIGSPFGRISTQQTGWVSYRESVPTVTTGKQLECAQFGQLAAATYSVSIRFRASSGSVTAKERVLRVGVMGV